MYDACLILIICAFSLVIIVSALVLLDFLQYFGFFEYLSEVFDRIIRRRQHENPFRVQVLPQGYAVENSRLRCVLEDQHQTHQEHPANISQLLQIPPDCSRKKPNSQSSLVRTAKPFAYTYLRGKARLSKRRAFLDRYSHMQARKRLAENRRKSVPFVQIGLVSQRSSYYSKWMPSRRKPKAEI